MNSQGLWLQGTKGLRLVNTHLWKDKYQIPFMSVRFCANQSGRGYSVKINTFLVKHFVYLADIINIFR